MNTTMIRFSLLSLLLLPLVFPNTTSAGSPDKPVSCGETTFTNLTTDQGKALKFVLERELVSPSIACITELVATDKFPLRGQTVIKYKATIYFPNGYATECLQKKDFNTHGFGAVFQQVNCSGPGIEPAKVGETRTYVGEKII